MNTQRYPYVALCGHVRGKRRQGRQKKGWTDAIKEDCNEMHLKFYDAIHDDAGLRSLEEVRGRAANACRLDITKALSQVKY